MARKIDDLSKRRKYKEEKFDGRKSMRDEYTGERIFYGNAGLKNKHSSRKTADGDHVTPLDKVQKRYAGLTPEQQRELANDKSYNYAMTNSKLNRSKKGLENHEYLWRQWKRGKPEDLETTLTMLTKEGKSRTYMRVKATGMYAGNAAEAAKGFVTSGIDKEAAALSAQEATKTAMTAATMSAIHNIYAVAAGEKDTKEAAKDVLETTGSAFVAQAVKTYCEEKAWKEVTKLTTEEACAFLRSEVNGCAGQIAAVIETSKVLVKYIDGQIDAEECAAQIGIGIVGYLAHGIGNAILPPIGGIAAQMIAESVCRVMYAKMMEMKAEIRENKKKLRRLNAALNEAIVEMKFQQQLLADEIKVTYEKWDERSELGFRMMLESIAENEFEKFTDGLDILLELFDSHVLFKTEQEFDEFFFDDSAVLNL